MLRTILLALVLTLAVSPADAARRRSSGSPPDTWLSAEGWLRRHAQPLQSAQPGAPFDDLRPFGSMVGDARLVLLGEPTHGTHESWTMRHRVIEYLVREQGFTVVALEAPMPELDAINDYVQHGIGNPNEILTNLGWWLYDSDEMRALVEWMRAYNVTRGERPALSFHGFDLQRADVAITKITEYLQRVDPSSVASVTSRWSCFDEYRLQYYKYTALPKETRDACRAELLAAHDALAAQRAEYVARSRAAEYEVMLRYALIIVQTESHASIRVPQGRDAAMADNVDWLANVRHPGEKLVLLSHNAHAVLHHPLMMGAHLRTRYSNREFVSVGLLMNQGEFAAYHEFGPAKVFHLPEWNDSYDPIFRSAGHAMFYADLRDISSPHARAAFSAPGTMWRVGALFNEVYEPRNWRQPIELSRTYDIIFWFANTSAARVRVLR